MSTYEQDLEPLLDCINIIFQAELVPVIKIERQKYKSEFLSSESSKKDFTPQIKAAVKKTLTLLSRQYIRNLYYKYFSEEGLISYVFFNLFQLTIEYKE